jgi:stress-induced-phosphoprotein 1
MAEFKEKGNQYFKEQNYEKAIEFYSKAIEAEPSNHIFYSNRSLTYFKMNMFVESLKDADMSIEYNSSWAKGFQRKGAAEGKMGKLWQAFISYSIGNIHDPANAGINNE